MFNKLPKFLIMSFLLVFAFQLAGLIFFFVMPEPSMAAGTQFTPQVTVGDNFTKDVATTPNIAEYIKSIYVYAIGIVGILAAVVLMFGGVLWITAGGNNEKISNAKSWIAASLSGLVLALCSYVILATVNPELVKLENPTISQVNEIPGGTEMDLDFAGCCQYFDASAKRSFCKKELEKNCQPDILITAEWKGPSFNCDSTSGQCKKENSTGSTGRGF